jgi:hypothetical protein
VTWPVPELDDGAEPDDRPPEALAEEFDDELLEPAEPELAAELPVLAELPVPDEEAAADWWAEAGRVKATTPAAATPASPVTVVTARSRLRPASRAATACAIGSRRRLLMTFRVGDHPAAALRSS